ncbi:hypothetical protein PAEPH01_2722, partial [Pancytospora epiphaga]
ICGNYKNYYKYETYEFKFSPVIGNKKEGSTSEAEHRLLELLDKGDLEVIIEQKDRLDEERMIVENGKVLGEYFNSLGTVFIEVKNRFNRHYGLEASLSVYKEAVALLEGELNVAVNLPGVFTEVRSLLLGFYEHSFPGCGLPFDIHEITKYSFDYSFFTSFNELFYHLKGQITFDLEISAGSPESNGRVAELLAENSSRCILVLNAHFLEPMVKTGTNRFIFIFECNEYHPLIENTRVVHYDRRVPYELMCRQVQRMFNSNSEMIGFHAYLLDRGMKFSLNDLETVLMHENIHSDYLREVIYYNRMKAEEKEKIITGWDSLKDHSTC